MRACSWAHRIGAGILFLVLGRLQMLRESITWHPDTDVITTGYDGKWPHLQSSEHNPSYGSLRRRVNSESRFGCRRLGRASARAGARRASADGPAGGEPRPRPAPGPERHGALVRTAVPGADR